MRIRQHVNPLRTEYQRRRSFALELPEGREVELEIGCADAQFLFERAAQDSQRIQVGIEIREELVRAVNAQAAARGVEVRALFSNVNVDLDGMFPPGRLARCFVNFPDPWFKTRQKKRRVVDDELIAAIARAVREGGELFFQSDIFELALEAMDAIETRDDLFENAAGPWSFWRAANPYGVRSRREEQCEGAGSPIWRILYYRRDQRVVA